MANRISVLALAVLSVGLGGGGCDKVRAVVCEPVKAAAAPQPAAAGAKAPAADGANPAAAAGHDAEPAAAKTEPKEEPRRNKSDLLTSTTKFALPFAWEKSPTEPLSRAKTYLRELADDNTQYMAKGAEYFKAFAAAESPRATIVTCADSRVQSAAFDATPENDGFTVRNLANQLDSSLGSVQYGVTQLNTPVLLIVGHTGCTAIKAALTGSPELDEPTRRELAGLHLKKSRGPVDDKRWTSAVLDNVHDQVRQALKYFGPRVNSGELTVIGAVYDFRNDLGRGVGRLSVIDVNGNQDPGRLKAFGEAIMATPNPRGKREDPLDRLARALAESTAVGPEAPEEDEAEAEETPPESPPESPEPTTVKAEQPSPAAQAEHPAPVHAAEPPAAVEHPPEGRTIPARRAAPKRH